jgi:WD40 repeat protein
MAASGSAGALWRLSDGVKMASFNHGGPMAFSRDSRFFLMGDSGNADLWNLITGKVVRRYGPEDFFSRAAYGLALSPNGGTLVVLAGPAAHLWDLNIGAEIYPFGERTLKSGVRDEPAGSSVAFSPDGKSILSGPAYDQRLDGPGLKKDTEWVKLWDLASLAVTRHFPLLVEDINPSGGGKVAISANGRYAAASQTNAVTVWDLANDKEVRRIVVPVVTELAGGGSGTRVIFDNFDALAISGDGRRVVTGINDNIVRLWDTGTGEQIRKFEGHTRTIRAADMTPDGKLAITGSEDKTARLWSLDDGRATCTFARHSGSVTAVAFSPSAKFAATGSADATARLWDVTTCREVTRFEGHTDTVNAVAFSPDGKHLFTACEDSTINIWDTSSGKLLATIVNFPEGWAVTDPEGRYDASDPDRSPTLYWLVGLDVIELGQLKQRFYTPGLLGKIMRGEPLPSVAGLRDIKRVPDVDVTVPEEGSTEASVELINRGGGIGRLIVKVNGREVPNATRGAAPDPNAAVGAVKIDLAGATLSPTGKNVIEVFADSGDGVIRSRGVTVEWDRQPPKEAQPRLFAIIAGVSQYDSSALNLRYPSKDALDFGHALQLAAKGLFGDRASITILGSGTNLEPTKENLRNAFDKVAKEAHSGDLLVVYLAGHGVAARVEHDQYYFLTKEARSFDIDRDSGLREFSTVSSAELKEWLSRKNMPLKQVIILDTCAAGAALDEMVKLADRRSLSPDQIRAIELLKDSTGSWVLMGSAADAVSYEANKYAQGLLTYALLEGMKGAALDGDQVEVSKLFGFAQRQVEDLSRGIGGLQRPVLSAPKGQTFPIGLLTLIDREKIHLASAKPELLRARVHDEDDLDSLKLEPAVRADLRANSMPAAPGSPQHDPEIAYLDSVVDEVPDALIPLIRYSVEGQSLKVRLRLLRNGKPVWDRNLELAGTDAEKASQQLATEIVAAAEKVD